MFAVIKTGGKQYKVAATDQIEIEKLPGAAGDPVAFGDVLMVGGDDGVAVGAPLVEGATVAGEIVGHSRGDRIIVFKKRRRQNSKRSRGHRQDHTVVRITEILTDGAKPAKAAKPAKKAKTEAAPKAEEAPKAEAKAPAPKKAEATKAPAAADAPDDLKKISGVGPVLEKKLHALGIKTYTEIAGWSADDVTRIDDELNFKGRIERDGWIDQARQLLADKE
ncbi:MAG: 50S ribosomal protein L21 [Alphaproteobacteria bacterium]